MDRSACYAKVSESFWERMIVVCDINASSFLEYQEMGYSGVLSEEIHRGTALHGGRAMLTKGLTLLKEPNLANVVSDYYPTSERLMYGFSFTSKPMALRIF